MAATSPRPPEHCESRRGRSEGGSSGQSPRIVTSATLPRPSSPGEARRASPSRTAGGQPCSRVCRCFRNKCALGTLPTSQQPPPTHALLHPSPRRAPSPACLLVRSFCARTHVCACDSRAGRTSGVHEWTRMGISVCVHLSGAFCVRVCQHAPGRRCGCVPCVSALGLGVPGGGGGEACTGNAVSTRLSF